jgi:hypothetical protein
MVLRVPGNFPNFSYVYCASSAMQSTNSLLYGLTAGLPAAPGQWDDERAGEPHSLEPGEMMREARWQRPWAWAVLGLVFVAALKVRRAAKSAASLPA